ncbi:TRAP transporter small permease [Vreelandella subglaciescola]|jgi:TRAP-type C4-dicarboxylate transport system permease small subunit|uniref:TRAP transporter small permease protein n=1 Tax=Vreelandella subglaciescola TaxID=29571 RepID=A0A1M7H047_9GAMM|nr:TRAP transporter small permease [Halomonas subglaciescola]SHM21768.1 TRAP-type C4-dicarboxylate transport system, small permease component [Halomonas subglaciescola]
MTQQPQTKPQRSNALLNALSVFDRVLGTIEKWIITVSILGMALLMSTHVVSSLIFNAGISGTYEVTEMLIVIITFVGVSYAARHARHISMSAIYEQLTGRLRKGLLIIICIGTAALMFYFAYKSLGYVTTMQSRGRTSSALHIPMWIVYTSLPIGFTLAGVQYVLTAVRNMISKDIYRNFREKEEFTDVPTDGI